MKLKTYFVAVGTVVVLLSVYLIETEKSINVKASVIENKEKEQLFENYSKILYKHINIAGLNYEAFKFALKGYYLLKTSNKLSNSKILGIIDFSKSSNYDRFYVIDMENSKLLFKSLVAHGKNSGEEYASRFSNIPESYMSSLGFYITGETYMGKHGLSLRLDGKEPKFNDNARNRDIVIHSAVYVCEDFIKTRGRLGRSYGCPALPAQNYNKVLESIKAGTCIFAYYPDNKYLKGSKLLNNKNYLASFTEELSLLK